MKPTKTIVLMGGLGNQIFQVAKALSGDSNELWNCDSRLMRPRLGKNGNLELLQSPLFTSQLVKPPKFKKIDRFIKPTYPLRKLALWLLENEFEKLSKSQKMFFQVLIPVAGVMYTHTLSRITIERHQFGLECIKRTMIIGFFQDVDPVGLTMAIHKLKQSFAVSGRQDFSTTLATPSESLILVVHMRRGDFANHPTLGMLSLKYYLEAIKKALSQRQYDCIWFFSDDISSINELLRDNDFGKRIEIPDKIELDALSVLELMRRGDGFVLSNSTLGWWASALAYRHDASVYMPDPWTIIETQQKPPKLGKFTDVQSIFE